MIEKKILLTGISGFIAKHCAIELITHGYSVRGTVRNLAKAAEVRATLGKHCDISGLEIVAADLSSDDGWREAMQGISGVLHVASPFPVVDVRDIAKMHRLVLETTAPSGGRYMGVSETAWFIDMMRPIKARLGRSARKVPSFEMPNLLVRFVAIFDAAARGIVPELGYLAKVDNSRTRKTLGIDFIPVAESAPAIAQSLVDLNLV